MPPLLLLRLMSFSTLFQAIGFLAFLILSSCQSEIKEVNKESFSFPKPAKFGEPVYRYLQVPENNEAFELGKALFFDPILSVDSSVSCGSCHVQEFAFADGGKSKSLGLGNRTTRRNSPSLQNLAWSRFFLWDGGIFELDLFPVLPITHPDEMGENLNSVILKLQRHSKYNRAFANVFGKRPDVASLMKALSAYQVQLVSASSPFDDFMAGFTPLNPQAMAGYQIFQENCSACHKPPLFGADLFTSNGLPILDSTDKGRYEISLFQADKYKFKVPTLRNIEVTGPYMHDGRFKTLEQVIDHYSERIKLHSSTDSLLVRKGPLRLSTSQKQALKAFLLTLTDQKFLTNKVLKP